ncbi:MAG TPA: 50S ribosomal protein L29 [Opitutaceae bacterium]
MKAKEIRDLSTTELDVRLRETRQQLLMLRLRRQTGQVEKTHELRGTRRDIARMETILNEKQRAAAPAAK